MFGFFKPQALGADGRGLQLLARSLLLAVVVTLATGVSAAAQSCTLSVGDSVRILTNQDLVELELSDVLRRPSYFGTLEEPRAGAVSLMTDRELLLLPYEAVRRVDGLCQTTTTPGRDGLSRGVKLGGGTGLVVGLLYAALCDVEADLACSERTGRAPLFRGTVGGGVLGAMLGGLIGSFVSALQGEYQWIPTVDYPRVDGLP